VTRVARWYIFEPNISNLVNFGGLWNGKTRVARWYIFEPNTYLKFGKFWRALEWKELVHFMATWDILQQFGIF
jgi:hypothetical protein